MQIGTVGGGNHFVEIQAVEELVDGATARSFGLTKNAVTIMAHAGSVGLGHAVGGYFNERARSLFPAGVPHPAHGFCVLPAVGPHAREASSHPVIIPGSMGDASWVLAGAGHAELLAGACHGAGRSLTRGRSAHADEDLYRRAVEKLHVVTPLDPDAPNVRRRRDILAKYHQRMKEEAPYAYKPITPVVRSVEDAGIARRVARLCPLVTVKG